MSRDAPPNGWMFNEGDDVPEWLVDAEPRKASAPRPPIRFTCDVAVLDFGDNYFIAPVRGTPGAVITIDATPGHTLRVFAASKNVRIPTGWMFMGAEGDKA